MNRYNNRYQQPCPQHMNMRMHEQRQSPNMAMPERAEACVAMPLAVPFVQWQEWTTVYDPDTALRQGTIFPQLDLPFCGSEVRRR